VKHLLATATRTAALLGLAAVASSAFGGSVWARASAQDADLVPPATVGIGVTQRIGDVLPLDALLVNTRGESVALADVFDGEHPVLLTFNYSDCPQLCSLQLNSLVSALREVEYTIGEDFEVVTVSIDPNESAARAALTQERYRNDYVRASEAPEGAARRRTEERKAAFGAAPATDFHWHFLTGDDATITRVADAAGFAYRLDPITGEYAHDAVVVVLTPTGTISRYLPGVFYEPRDIELALVSASEGELGGVVAWLRQTCYRWDPNASSYVLVAERLMFFGAGAGALVLAIFLGLMWRRELARSKADSSNTLPPNELPLNTLLAHDAGSDSRVAH
jgi:protein SCO1/2